ncbi:MAG: flagellar biosynthetic protein FliO [Burkholderiaceae bacterium]
MASGQTLLLVVVFVLLLAMVPAAIKRWQARTGTGAVALGAGARIISALAVGPQQRVITVEVGPLEARTWLVLGVTQQSIACLHQIAMHPGTERPIAEAVSGPVGHR